MWAFRCYIHVPELDFKNLQALTFVMGPETVGIKNCGSLIFGVIFDISRLEVGMNQARFDSSSTSLQRS